ncbi:MAG: glutamate--tRNA ligase [Patescibacteria group bacterium]|jgi:glutamyl-tRNA synthetase
MIRTRFAPSPTGLLHVGGLRTALYQYLFAKNNGGKFLVRIEDTDRERTVEGGIQNILSSLYWAGVIPDEGVKLNEKGEMIQVGDFGPYIQSERLEIYQKHAEFLIENKFAYHCFCTADRLDQIRHSQQENKKPTGYDRFCLTNVSDEEAQRRVAAGEKHVIRLKMPREGETKFKDLIRGEVVFKNELVDDQVLIKSDGFPTYHLAVVVDDHFMQISHVIRGEEWISSTPKHIQLYKCFGWELPVFAHLSLLLNSDKSKLSKRQGDVSVSEYEKNGYLPEALVNFVAFLGWNPGGEREIFSLEELVKEFDLGKVNKTGAVFNLEKLDWFNKEYLKNLSAEEIFEKAGAWLTPEQKMNPEKTKKVIALEKDRIKNFSELSGSIKFLYELPEYSKELLIWKKSNLAEVQNILPQIKTVLSKIEEKEWSKLVVEQSVMSMVKEKGYNNGMVLWPLRVALSGQENSPGPFEIAEVLGKTESQLRIEISLSKLA